MDRSSRSGVRRAILQMEKPFCISDLFLRLEKQGIKDHELILQVLDELYDEGMIEYRKVEGMIDEPRGNANWFFAVAC